MKSLNQRAVEVLKLLLQSTQPVIAQTINGAREVEAKMLHKIGRYRIMSLTFYKDEDGYRFREPEITIIHDMQSDEYTPSGILYELERINSASASFFYSQLTVWNDQIQADHAEYSNRLLESIAVQCGIEV